MLNAGSGGAGRIAPWRSSMSLLSNQYDSLHAGGMTVPLVPLDLESLQERLRGIDLSPFQEKC